MCETVVGNPLQVAKELIIACTIKRQIVGRLEHAISRWCQFFLCMLKQALATPFSQKEKLSPAPHIEHLFDVCLVGLHVGVKCCSIVNWWKEEVLAASQYFSIRKLFMYSAINCLLKPAGVLLYPLLPINILCCGTSNKTWSSTLFQVNLMRCFLFLAFAVIICLASGLGIRWCTTCFCIVAHLGCVSH